MTDEQRLQILTRAEEIRSQGSIRLDDSTEIEQLLSAAEETGLPRDAVMQALRERIVVDTRPVELGSLVFAKSADGCSYPARVTMNDDSIVHVEFLSGASATLVKDDVRAFTALPGQILNCPWPHFGWWDCRVLSFDVKREMVHVSDGWGSEHWFFIKDVRVKPDPGPVKAKIRQWGNLIAVSIASGVLGAILMRVFLR